MKCIFFMFYALKLECTLKLEFFKTNAQFLNHAIILFQMCIFFCYISFIKYYILDKFSKNINLSLRKALKRSNYPQHFVMHMI